HAPAFRRRVRRLVGGDASPIRVLRSTSAPDLTEWALSGIREGGVVFGFGNIGGVGEELVEHWAGVGEAVGDGV
ncbi:MAG: hypothetical protein KAJ42_10840, partial [Gemmatimonadetes bacterium]|nr:hypothetical protein [Gemmatimonadota bacterium]